MNTESSTDEVEVAEPESTAVELEADTDEKPKQTAKKGGIADMSAPPC